jgi:type IV secretory pathway VirB10-like protein
MAVAPALAEGGGEAEKEEDEEENEEEEQECVVGGAAATDRRREPPPPPPREPPAAAAAPPPPRSRSRPGNNRSILSRAQEGDRHAGHHERAFAYDSASSFDFERFVVGSL